MCPHDLPAGACFWHGSVEHVVLLHCAMPILCGEIKEVEANAWSRLVSSAAPLQVEAPHFHDVLALVLSTCSVAAECTRCRPASGKWQ